MFFSSDDQSFETNFSKADLTDRSLGLRIIDMLLLWEKVDHLISTFTSWIVSHGLHIKTFYGNR